VLNSTVAEKPAIGLSSKDYQTVLDTRLIVFRLLAQAIQQAAPQQDFQFRMVIVMPVLAPEYAPVAEHTVSELAGSYTKSGGTNASVAGQGGMEATARRGLPHEIDERWSNAASSSLVLGVLQAQFAEAVERLSLDKLYWQWRLWGLDIDEHNKKGKINLILDSKHSG